MFREIGIPQRIGKVYTTEEIEKFRKKYNGKKNCYISLFSYTKDVKMNRWKYNSAIVDKLFFDFEPKCWECHHSLKFHKEDDYWKCVSKKCRLRGWNQIKTKKQGLQMCLDDINKMDNQFFKQYNIEPRYRFTGGNGFHIIIDVPILDVKYKNEVIYKLRDRIERICGSLRTLCHQTRGEKSQMIRMVNTIHMETGSYCVNLTKKPFNYGIDKILKLSQKNRIFNPEIKKCGNWIVGWAKEFDKKIEAEKKKEKKQITFKEIRPCVLKMMEEGTHGYLENFIIATELINVGGKSDEEVEEHFRKTEPAYNKRKTQKYINIIREKYHYVYGENKLKRSPFCLGEECEYYDKEI